jgi:uncharacterized protein (DUF2141 family)
MNNRHIWLWVGVCTAVNIVMAQPLRAQVAGNSVDVSFTGLKSSQGQVCISVYAGPQGFPDGGKGSDFVTTRCSPITAEAATLTLTDLKPGNYAIVAHHDLNGDGTMNKGSFGIPEEGFGFSNNPEIGFSSPSFDETKFAVAAPQATVKILMRYLN